MAPLLLSLPTYVSRGGGGPTDGRTDGRTNERSFVSDKSKVNSDVSLSLRDKFKELINNQLIESHICKPNLLNINPNLTPCFRTTYFGERSFAVRGNCGLPMRLTCQELCFLRRGWSIERSRLGYQTSMSTLRTEISFILRSRFGEVCFCCS